MPGIPLIEPYDMPVESELPPNTAQWVAQPHRAVLLVHDLQRYFLRAFPDGRAPADELVRNAARLMEHARALGIPVAYTAQPGGMSDEQRGLLKDFWGPGMRVDPADREVVGAVAPRADDWVLTKWRYSAFFRSDLLVRMLEQDRDQLIVCGVYAHVGVLATAVEAFSNDIQTFLAADAVADFSRSYHDLALQYAAARCAVVATTDRLLAQLGSPARVPEVAR